MKHLSLAVTPPNDRIEFIQDENFIANLSMENLSMENMYPLLRAVSMDIAFQIWDELQNDNQYIKSLD